MPINAVSAALYAAIYRDLPDIEYSEVDYAAERKYLDKLSTSGRAEYYALKRTNADINNTNGEFMKECGIPYVTKRIRPNTQHVEVTMFRQTWGSTALGYGGIGGQAMSSAYTVIVSCEFTGASCVYFGGGKLAYTVPSENKNEAWREAIATHNMPECGKHANLFVPRNA